MYCSYFFYFPHLLENSTEDNIAVYSTQYQNVCMVELLHQALNETEISLNYCESSKYQQLQAINNIDVYHI